MVVWKPSNFFWVRCQLFFWNPQKKNLNTLDGQLILFRITTGSTVIKVLGARRNPSENDFYLFLLVFLTENSKTSTEKDFPKHLAKKNHLSLGGNCLTRRSGPPGVKASTGGPAGEEPCLSGRKMSLQPSVEAIDGRPDVDNASTKRRRMSADERLVRSRERNRHHAKMTRLRKKQKMEFLQVIF